MTCGPLLLGIDAGTSRVRAMVFTPDGRALSEGSETTPTDCPRPGWAEHDADAIWSACCRAVHAALVPIQPVERIRGLAISSVGEALVPLDDRGRPTHRVIAWYDERTTPQLDRLIREIGKDRLFKLTGLSADPTFSLLKLLWLKEQAPDALSDTSHWLNVNHYLAWRFTGVAGSDHTQASRTLAFDLQRHVWAEDLIEELGLAPTLFPPLRALGAKLGSITSDAATETGLPTDCAVGVGGHDHLIGALAADVLTPGVMLNSLGTAEAITMAMPRASTDLDLMRRGFNQGAALVDDRVVHYVFGGLQASGASIEWFRRLFGQAVPHRDLIAAAERVPPGSDGVAFLPDLRGRISPNPDPLARGAWYGLSTDCNHETLYRAILEGLAFEARLTVDALTELPDVPAIDRIHAIGGNTQNPLLMRIKASVYQCPITAAEMPEATALGSALLGGVAANLWPDLASAVRDLALPVREVAPVDAWIERYDRQFETVHRPAYAALRPLHHAIRALNEGQVRLS